MLGIYKPGASSVNGIKALMGRSLKAVSFVVISNLDFNSGLFTADMLTFCKFDSILCILGSKRCFATN